LVPGTGIEPVFRE